METLKNFLWPVVLLGGLGVFIDFLIGKAGQAKAKDFLLIWWVRFDDVQWRNFGREEGLFAGRLIEIWFGKRIWSLRRVCSALILLAVFMMIGLSRLLLSREAYKYMHICYFCGKYLFDSRGWLELLISAVAYCVSVSFTKSLAFRMADLCGVGELRNISIFVVTLFFNYVLLAIWLPITTSVKNTLFSFPMLIQSFTFLSSLGLIPYNHLGDFARIWLHYPAVDDFRLEHVRSLVMTKLPIDLFTIYSLVLCP